MVYEILIIYIIYLINDNSIINKTQEKSNFLNKINFLCRQNQKNGV